MSPQSQLILQAPAKLNLFLHVTGRRDDGYHLLQSLMVFVDRGDFLAFSPYDGFLIDVEGPFAGELAGQPQDNLICKAAQALAAEYGVQPRGRVLLTKNLPIASGIGGGSSDAAAALRGFVKLWGLPWETTRLHRLARGLGADVPACLAARPIWAEGIGDEITHLQDLPDMHFVLVNPLVATPTPEVFRRFRDKFSAPLQFSGRRKSMREWIADFRLYRNDLTDPAKEVCPEIGEVLQALSDTPNCQLARLSGSGATCFGIYDNLAAAQAAVNKLRLARPGWWIVTANLLK